MRHRLPAVAALLLVAACTPSPENRPTEAHGASAQDLAAISRLHDAYVLAHNDADVSRMTPLFTEDAVLMPTDEPAITGRGAIGDHYEEFFDQTPSKILLRPIETRVAGDWAFERLEMTVTMPGGGENVMEAKVKYLWILERQKDGSWKIARAIYNLDEDFAESDGQNA
ncbi:MAG TPA: SgcJ/EcaC family oxidoreductase [Candidatus Binatia bacterium]|nr:SgcJ/EcaC family oxidoreductase [Candidatus Binatia bacterium]